jgi:hypothetical protein
MLLSIRSYVLNSQDNFWIIVRFTGLTQPSPGTAAPPFAIPDALGGKTIDRTLLHAGTSGRTTRQKSKTNRRME